MGDVRAFGWRHSVRATVDAEAAKANGMEQVPEEADAIRDAARRLLAGEGITALARDWNAKGYRRPRGGTAWSSTTVRDVLTSPRNAGLVQHRGEVVGEAQWEPILDRVTYERVVAVLNDPGRRVGARSRSTFTGVFICGVCGERLMRDASAGKVVWRCKPSPGRPHCGKIAITGSLVESAVIEAAMRAVDAGTLPERLAERSANHEDDRDAEEIAVLERRLTDLSEMFGDGAISRGEWLAARRRIENRLQAARARVGSSPRGAALAPYRAGATLRGTWPTLTVEQQNLVLRAVYDPGIVVHPASSDRPKATDRLDPLWAG
jgi:hypothetical protein